MASKVAVPQAEEAAPASPEEAPAGVPGAAFYAARLQRAAALPPAQRSCDVAAFLECDRLLGLAADLLNSLSVAAEQEDRPRAALGLLAYLCGTAGELALGGRRWSAPRFLTPLRLTPAARLAATWLVTLWEGRPAVPAPLALLLEPDGGSEAAWGSAPPLADLLLLLKVLAYCASVMGRSAGAEVEPRLRLCHKLVRHALRSLTEPANGAVLAAQLQQAQRSADAAGASWQLPDAAALAWLAARLEVSLCTSQAIVAAAQQRDGQEQGRAAPAGGLQASDEGAVQARRAAAVERFAELCPDSPLACDLLADVWMFNNPERAAGHLRRGLALAQEQGSDLWAAALGYQAAFQASRCWVDSVPPQEALALLADADAAHERCRRLLPEDWVVYVQREQRRAHAMRPYLDMHGSSPRRWLPLVFMPELGLPGPEAEVCAGCGQHSAGLRTCSRCGAAKFCSEACFQRAWPQHRAAGCAASKQAAGASLMDLSPRMSRQLGDALQQQQAAEEPRAGRAPPATGRACGREGAHMRCARCGLAAYCGRDCQAGHWRVHRRVCQASAPGRSS